MEWPSWGEMFVPDGSLVESFLRGSFVYLALLAMFRVIMRRQAGSLGLPDVMLVVLVSECVSQALTSENRSIPNGFAAVSGLLFWNYTLDRLSHRWPWLHRLLEPRPLQLVRDGKAVRQNLDAEGISDEELAAQLRLNGVQDLSQVKSAVMESEGEVSVIRKEDPGESQTELPKPDASPRVFEQTVKEFAVAALELQKAIALHEAQAGKHREAAKAARKLLKEHGVETEPVPARRRTTSRNRTRSKTKGTRKPAPGADAPEASGLTQK